jgi:hypothetical protein
MINVSASSVPALSQKEQRAYTRALHEVHEDLKLIHKAFVRLARNLAKIRDRRLYFAGGYATFEEFCGRELGRSRQQIYRIIAAHDTLKLLMDAGIPETDLPETERLCREIRSLPTESQPSIWRAVRRAKAKPTIVDIQAEAVKQLNSDDTIERQQKEILSKFEGMARGLKMGLTFDTLTDDYRRRLTVALMSIADSVKLLLTAINSPVIDPRSQQQSVPPAQTGNRLSSKAKSQRLSKTTLPPTTAR